MSLGQQILDLLVAGAIVLVATTLLVALIVLIEHVIRDERINL